METIIKEALCFASLVAGRIIRHQHEFIIKHSNVANILEATYDWKFHLIPIAR